MANRTITSSFKQMICLMVKNQHSMRYQDIPIVLCHSFILLEGIMQNRTIQIVWVSNIYFEPYIQSCINGVFTHSNYDVQLNFIMCKELNEKLEVFRNAGIIVVCLNFQEICPNLLINALKTDCLLERVYKEIYDMNQNILSYIKTNSNAKVVWFGFEDYFSKAPFLFGTQCEISGLVDRINIALCEALIDDIFVDFKRLIAVCGVRNSYSDKGKYRWNAPYSKELIQLMANEVYKQYLIENGITKKCFVLDCDNVLWGGILSEDGIENLKIAGSGLGRLYQDFQRFVLSLYYHGVILAVCSKNDLSDVLTVFREHSEMILKEEHIAYFQVNWADKPGNIRKIAEKLNIGLDSMVFVDDSPVEIGAVKTMLPEVTAILFERDMAYEQFSCFNLKSDVCLADIEKRNETYRTNAKRLDLKEQSGSYDEYVKALEVKTEIHRIIPMEYSRVSELTQRTNKCTNGRRLTVQEIKGCIENDETDFYSVHVSDRFSDLGLVGAFAIKDNELVLFSLSCRALGREIENTMLEYIISNWKIERMFFHSTGKNTDLKNVLEEKIHPVFVEQN